MTTKCFNSYLKFNSFMCGCFMCDFLITIMIAFMIMIVVYYTLAQKRYIDILTI